MAAVNKIDSNVTGARYTELTAAGAFQTNPVWIGLEPNSYDAFGANITTVARNFLNDSRQRSKGVTVDLDASGGLNTDLTQTNAQDLMQGFMFADFRKKGEIKNELGRTNVTLAVATTNSRFTAVNGDPSAEFSVGSLVFIAGAANAANNGLFVVTAVTSTTFDVAQADGSQTAATLVDESATAAISAVEVGFEFADSDLDVDASSGFFKLTTTTKDFTTLGLVVGEPIQIGGNASGTFFATNAANNTFAYVRAIAANVLTLDVTDTTMVTESSGASDQIHLYFGRVLKNEAGTLIKQREYEIEVTLGANDDASPTNLQAQYLQKVSANTLGLNQATADKINMDLGFIGSDFDLVDENNLSGNFKGTSTAEDAIKSESSNLGSIKVDPPIADAFNTSSHVVRTKLAVVQTANSNPSALFGFATEVNLTINNNVSPNKAIGRLGAFSTTVGTFQVGGSLTVYFSDVAAIQAVIDNNDVSFDTLLFRSNAGIALRMPLVALGDGRANIELDQPITLPLTLEAARGRSVDTNLDHTLLVSFFDYLPDRVGA